MISTTAKQKIAEMRELFDRFEEYKVMIETPQRKEYKPLLRKVCKEIARKANSMRQYFQGSFDKSAVDLGIK